ncbi:hypothetical protein [Amycolatopsis sp. cmx-4-61]|uniref:hypothetical protein n=1 Tax=Amycolatopsis sp. cmx-4-61 TaxID=2790937 RepID=UPI00397D0F88
MVTMQRRRVVRPATVVEAATTVAAMAASTYSYIVGKQIQHAALDGDVTTEADLDAERHQRLLRAERALGWVQWAVPAHSPRP